MGQQQLLLLVLGAIIVGVSVVVGINLFGENALQANQDAVVQDCINIASRAQEWYRKPAAIGGGNRSFTGMTLALLNIADSTANGSYQLTGTATDTTFQITGTGVEGSPLEVVMDVGVSGITSTAITP